MSVRRLWPVFGRDLAHNARPRAVLGLGAASGAPGVDVLDRARRRSSRATHRWAATKAHITSEFAVARSS